MTKHEAAVISAYTGILMCDFATMHEYIEKIMGGRPVFTHELADKDMWAAIKRKSSPDFIAICESVAGGDTD